MGLKKKQRLDRRHRFLEKLEVRQLLSVVNVTPGNFWGPITASNPGDTINFAPGNYGISSGAVPRLPGGRTYVGNGATFTSDGSAWIDLGYSNNLSFSGFVLNGVGAKADYANGLSFTNNTVEGANYAGFLTTGMSNSTVNNNTFLNEGQGVYGYPGNNNSVDSNRFDYVVEPIHFSTTCSGLDVSGNVITHATRIGIELQRSISNLTVNNNYFSDWLQQGTGGMDWHMAISCTDGGGGNAPFNDQGQNITISGNTFLQTGPAQNVMVWAKSAIEIMGQGNINITNNYSNDWGNLILNGAITTVNSSNNTVFGENFSSPDSVPWHVAGLNSSNDYFTNSSNNFPSAPGMPSAGANTSGSTSNSSSSNSSSSSSSAPASTTSSGSASLNGSQTTAASGYNLSSLGTSDWAYWGEGGVATNFDHSATGGSQISNVTRLGSGSYGAWHDSSRSVSFTGGTPLASDGGDQSYIWANNSIGAGYSFTVPADTTARTLYVYAGGFSSGATLTAHLSDGSSADFVATSSGNGIYSNLYTINYQAASAGQTLTVSFTKTTNINGSGGSVDLIGAALVGGSAGAPAGNYSNSTSNSGGLLNGVQGTPASGYNLTALGTTDWAHWGTGNNAGAFTHDANGGSQISNVTQLGSGSYGSYYDSSRSVSWSNGSPQGGNSGDSAYLWANNALGAGYSFTVPAGTTQHTLYVYAGGNSSGGTLTAHLSDGSAADFVATPSGNGLYTYLYTINFQAASAGQTLTISYVKSSNINGGGGSVDLIAAALV